MIIIAIQYYLLFFLLLYMIAHDRDIAKWHFRKKYDYVQSSIKKTNNR